MAKSGDNVMGLQLKGIALDYPVGWWQSRLVKGALPDVGSPTRRKEILLSQATAERLSLSIGDKVEMLFMEDERPRRDRFKLCGIYSTGLEEMDQVFAVVDIRDLRRVASWEEDQITGYDIFLKDLSEAEQVKQGVEQICYESDNLELANIVARDLMEREPVIFDWLKAHNINAEVIIVILLCVLIFNMASAMLIMVLDRRATIGLLKAQGMRNAAIRRMFLIRAMMLFLRGAFWGNLIGIGLVVAQDWWHIVELDASGYMLNFLPVSIEWWWLVALNVGVLCVTLLMLLLPSYLVARISPSESLRYR
jgi:lipoprotein-releasing system permease protein